MNEYVMCSCLPGLIAIGIWYIQAEVTIQFRKVLFNFVNKVFIRTLSAVFHKLIPSFNRYFCAVCFVMHNALFISNNLRNRCMVTE